MNFRLTKKVSKADFEACKAWAQYYEPDDIEELAKLGYEKGIVRKEIEAVNWSDDYWFPIPEETPVGTFQFEKRKTKFKSTSGKEFSGYVFNRGHSIGLWGENEEWIINENLLDMYEDEKTAIHRGLSINESEDLLPLEYSIEALGGTKQFPRKG